MKVRVQLKCATCGQYSPVNHLDHDGLFFCGTCGRDQPFDVDVWREYILPTASATGDAFWGNFGVFPPWPEGDMANGSALFGSEYGLLKQHLLQVGKSKTHVRLERSGGVVISDAIRSNSFIVECFPGTPHCPQCRAQWSPYVQAAGVVVAQCTQCGTRESYRVDEQLAKRVKDFVGALAPDHVEGRPPVRLEAEPGSAALAIKCGGCGAALHVTAGQNFVACSYCSTSSLIPDRVLSRTLLRAQMQPWWLGFKSPSRLRRSLDKVAAERERQADLKRRKEAQHRERSQQRTQDKLAQEQTKKADAAKKKWMVVGYSLFAGLAIVGAVVAQLVLPQMQQQEKAETRQKAEAARASDDVLERFSFDLSSEQAAELLRADKPDDLRVLFKPGGIVSRAVIYNGGHWTHYIELNPGDAFDQDGVERRLQEAAPNHWNAADSSLDLRLQHSRLIYDPKKKELSVSTRIKDPDLAKRVANTMWALIYYAATGKSKPSAEQLALLNGPKLSAFSKLDLSVPIEQAATTFKSAFPLGNCQTVTNGLTAETYMQCEIGTDHATIRSLVLAWSNAPKSSVDHVNIFFDARKPPPEFASCLVPALGPGKEIVTDHATGEKAQIWSLSKQGDEVRLGSWLSVTAPKQRPLGKPPAWTARFEALAKALDSCQLK